MLKHLLVIFTILSMNVSKAEMGPGEMGQLLSFMSLLAPAAYICQPTENGESYDMCISSFGGTTIATGITAAAHVGIVIAEKVVLERGDVGIIEADIAGNVYDPILLEALEVLRDEVPEKVDNLNDIEIIKLIQKLDSERGQYF